MAGNRALCAFLLCKSCFLRDIGLCGPMAWFPGACDLRALSWAHWRVRGAARRCWDTPAWPGSARFARSSYVNRALFGISTSAVEWGSCQRLPRRAYVPMLGHARHAPPARRPSNRRAVRTLVGHSDVGVAGRARCMYIGPGSGSAVGRRLSAAPCQVGGPQEDSSILLRHSQRPYLYV